MVYPLLYAIITDISELVLEILKINFTLFSFSKKVEMAVLVTH